MSAVSLSRAELETSFKIFCTNDRGIEVGESRGDELRRELNKSDYMVAIITDSYLRSPICIAELSAFWAKNGKIIPLIYNGQVGIDLFHKITGKDDIFLDGSDSSEDNKDKIIGQLKSVLKISETQAESIKYWIGKKQNDPDREEIRTFIGSTDVHNNIIQYCLQSGIAKIQNGGISSEDLESNLLDKQEVYLVGTTNKGIINNNIEIFSTLLSKKIDLYIMTANANHVFLRDVAAIESYSNGIDDAEWRKNEDLKFERLNGEFREQNQDNLKTIYKKAKEKNGGQIGHLYYGNAFTAIRQTITLGVNQKDLWAYVTMTLPPQRAAESLSFEVKTCIENNPFAQALCNYVYAIKALAERRKSIFEITDESAIIKEFPEA